MAMKGIFHLKNKNKNLQIIYLANVLKSKLHMKT